MKKLILILLFFSTFKAPAQRECSIKNFNTSNGMLQNIITGMSFDETGYLWIATQNSLIRYDGTNFKTCLLYNTTTTPNDFTSVHNISIIGSERKILIRGKNGLVYTIKDGQPVLYSDKLKDPNYFYTTRGNFPNQALFNKFNLPVKELINKHGWNPYAKELLPINETDFLVLGGSKTHVLGYSNGVKQNDIWLERPFNLFLKSGEHNLLADMDGGLYLYKNATAKFNKITANLPAVKEKEKSDKPVYYWDTYNDESYCYYNSIFYLLKVDTVRNSIDFIPRFFIKKDGHFWTSILYDPVNTTFFLGTLTDGLFQVKLKQVQTFNLAERISNNVNAINIINYAVLKTSDSTALSTTGFEFLVSGGTTTLRKKGNIFSKRETIAALGDTAILCAEANELYYYKSSDAFQQKRVFNAEFNKRNPVIITLLQPEGDSIWVCTNNSVYNIKGGNVKVIFTQKAGDGLFFGGCRLFFRFSKDDFFISSVKGLFTVKSYPPYTYDSFPEMENKLVRHISRYKDMLILSVYRHGIYIYKDKKFYRVPIEGDRPDLNFCHSTYIDKKEGVWITTDKGLYRSSISSLVEAALKPGNKPFFFGYGINDGIDNTEFNGAGTPAYALLGNGQVFYPSMGGIVTFIPDELNDKISITPIPIEKVVIDEKIIDPVLTDSFILAAKYKYLAIDFSIPHFGEPENLVLEYNLDDIGWKRIPVSPNHRLVLLEDFSSGYHKLQIRKRIGFSNNDYVYRTITLYKKKYLHERIWFFPAIAIAFVLLVLGGIRLQTNSLNNKRRALQKRVDEQTSELSKTVEVRELLINIISHDMTTPLRHVSFISGILSKELEKDQEKSGALKDIKTTTERILSGAIDIITLMKYNSQKVIAKKEIANLHSLVEETVSIYFPVAKSNNIAIKNEVDKAIFVVVDFTILSIILNNIVSNAVKHSKSGEVRIFVEQNAAEKGTVLKVSDTGKGISEEGLWLINEILEGRIQAVKTTSRISTGLGYVLISELVRIHGLSLAIESGLNEGTIVTLTIPFENDITDDVETKRR